MEAEEASALGLRRFAYSDMPPPLGGGGGADISDGSCRGSANRASYKMVTQGWRGSLLARVVELRYVGV